MNDLKIAIKQTDDIAWVIEAAIELSEATEDDLQAIKSKKWYNRLLDTITFSKDDQIRIAKDIGSLAKLQEIIIRILVMLSQENAAVSTAVRQQAELLKGLSSKDTALQNAIKKIKFGGTSQIDYSDLSREKKVLIASLLIMADPTAQRNEYSKQYIGSVLQIANITSFDNTIKPDAVDSLNKEEQELLYRMIMIHRYLMDADFDGSSEVLECIPISMKRSKEIRTSILETACVVSPEFFATYYEKTIDVFDEVSNDDIIFQNESPSEAEEHNRNEGSSKTDTTDRCQDENKDNTENFCVNYDEMDYLAEERIVSLIRIRLLVMKQESETSFYKSAEECSEGELKAILAQMSYPGQESTSDIIGIYDINPFHALNNNYSGILFLTKGFYFKENDRASLQYMKYSDIKRVEEKYFTLLIIGKHETIKLKSASYAQTYLAEAFRALASFRKEPEPTLDETKSIGTEYQNVQNDENGSAQKNPGSNVTSSTKPAVWLYPLAMKHDNLDIEMSGTIKELVRCSSPDALRLQIEGKVIEGNLTIGAYCKLEGQEETYEVIKMGFDGKITERKVGQSTHFTLKKIR